MPRPMVESGNLDMSFSGLKTAVALRAREFAADPSTMPLSIKADIARAFQDAVVDVLVAKSLHALASRDIATLVVAGGVGANVALRERLKTAVAARGARVFFPEAKYCTDNGAMIALAGALRHAHARRDYAFSVRPRWELQ